MITNARPHLHRLLCRLVAVNITLLCTATLISPTLYLQLKIRDIKINVETNDLKEQEHNFFN